MDWWMNWWRGQWTSCDCRLSARASGIKSQAATTDPEFLFLIPIDKPTASATMNTTKVRENARSLFHPPLLLRYLLFFKSMSFSLLEPGASRLSCCEGGASELGRGDVPRHSRVQDRCEVGRGDCGAEPPGTWTPSSSMMERR
jgi:hypothetical protein